MEALKAENETGWMRVEAAIARRAKEAAEQDARRAEAAAELEARREARLAKLESKLRDEVASLREAEAKRDAEAAKRTHCDCCHARCGGSRFALFRLVVG